MVVSSFCSVNSFIVSSADICIIIIIIRSSGSISVIIIIRSSGSLVLLLLLEVVELSM